VFHHLKYGNLLVDFAFFLLIVLLVISLPGLGLLTLLLLSGGRPTSRMFTWPMASRNLDWGIQ